MDRHLQLNQPHSFLSGGGEMGALMRAHDWSTSPLGQPSDWPQSLRAAASICLNSAFPIAIYWGPELALLYNDAWSSIPGEKHPSALGRPAREVWPEIWDRIGPLFERVQESGEGVWQQDELLPMRRRGYVEECYFNFTFSPIGGEDGRVGGVFNAVVETTFGVIEARRTRTLRDLAAHAADAKTADAACQSFATVIGERNPDIPVAFVYMLSDTGNLGRLVAWAGPDPRLAGAPAEFSLISGADVSWDVGRAVRDKGQIDLEAPNPLPGGAWPEPTHKLVAMPITRSGNREDVIGVLVSGINPRRALDDNYRGFLDLVARHLGAAIDNARSYEVERARAEALAEVDRAKTAFFANVSHEFRTPLTLLLGPLEEMRNRLGGSMSTIDIQDSRDLELAHRNGLRMLKLVNTLLDFSRIEAGRAEANYQETDIAALTADLASMFRSATDRAGLKLIVDCPELPAPAFVDPDMWEKIVVNLISNAFKYTHEGEIGVSLRHTGTHFELTVKDTGIGIPEDQLTRVFERFHRIVGALGRSHEGSGIGLSLVQELARLHGGSVTVESRYGKGTSFRVYIPVGKNHLPHKNVAGPTARHSTGRTARPFVDEALSWLPQTWAGQDDIIFDADTSPSKGQDGSARPYVLVAEDNADMRSYLVRLLATRYQVEAVEDGQAALHAIQSRRPDILVSDIMMPRLDGFALMRELRARDDTRTLPIILLSARAGEEARVEGLEAGADDYLAKPFSAKELIARVTTNLELAAARKRAEDEARRSEAFLQSIFAASGDCIKVCDLDGTLLYMNDRGLGLMEAESFDAFRGKRWPDLWPAESTGDIVKAIAIAKTGGTGRFTGFCPTANGTPRWWEVVVTSAAGPHGEPDRLIAISRDVTERRQAEQALRESEELFRAFTNATSDAVYRMSPDWAEMRQLHGRQFIADTPEPSRTWLEKYIHLEDQKHVMSTIRQAIASKSVFELEHRVLRVDGSLGWTSSRAIPILGEDGEIVEWFAAASDVTQRKQANAVQESERSALELLARGASLAEVIELLIGTIEEHSGDQLVGSVALLDRTETTFDASIGPRLPQSYHHAVNGMLISSQTGSCCVAVLGRQAVMIEDVTADAQWSRFASFIAPLGFRSAWSTPIFGSDGMILGTFANYGRVPRLPTQQDLTFLNGITRTVSLVIERKRAEASREEREKLQAFLLMLGDGLRPLADAVEIQDEATRMLGTHLNADCCYYFEADDQSGEYVIHRDYRRGDRLSIAGRYPYETFPLVSEGLAQGKPWVVQDAATSALISDTERPAFERANLSAVVVIPQVKQGRLVAALAVGQAEARQWTEDETVLVQEVAERTWAAVERARAEAALRESDARIQAMANAAPVLIWETDKSGTTFVNQHYLDFFGVSFDDVRGMGWKKFVHPDDIEVFTAAYRQSFAERRPLAQDVRLLRADGQYRWTRTTGRSLGDDRFVGVCLDITESKQAEETQQLLLGELNHRVKNTLATVQSIVQMTLRHTKDPTAFAKAFAGRVQSLSRVHSVLTDTTWKGADLRSLIDDQLLNGVIDKSQLTTSGPNLRLPPQLALHVALMLHELGTNAVKYGALTVTSGRVAIRWNIRDNVINLHWTERGGPSVTAPKGRGFGSTLIEQTAKSDGGEAHATFDEEGINWSITLPLPDGWSATPITSRTKYAAAPVVTPVASAKAKLAGIRVMIIEDEPLVAMDNVACLEAAGAVVVGEAGNIKDALRLIATADADVVLLDGNLHGAPVDDVAASLARRGIPFMFVTGYGSDSLPRAFASSTVLSKPFTPEQLVTAVLDMLQPANGVITLRQRGSD